MNMRSNELKKSCSSNSPFLISSSLRNSACVWSTECFNTSDTVRNCGLLSAMTQQLGEMEISQSVKAYKASIVLSLEVPGVRCNCISTSDAVISSTLRIFIFPFSTALVIDSWSELAVLVKGISRMTSVLLSIFSTLARTFKEPPRCPSLYFEMSMLPPVGKSG